MGPGPSNYGPDVDNSSNYKAVGAWGPSLGHAHSCAKAVSLGLSSGQGGGWEAPLGRSAPCGSDFSGQAVCTHMGHSKTVQA